KFSSFSGCGINHATFTYGSGCEIDSPIVSPAAEIPRRHRRVNVRRHLLTEVESECHRPGIENMHSPAHWHLLRDRINHMPELPPVCARLVLTFHYAPLRAG